MKKLVFLATEDWFVRSHFAPLVRRAHAEGYEVIVAARGSGADLSGARLVDMPFTRGALSLGALWREAGAVRALLRREQPAIVHAIALKPIALLLLAGAQGAGRALAVTGRGYLAARETMRTRLMLGVLARAVRGACGGSRTVLLVENQADRAWVERGQRLADARVVLLPGAGVDPDVFSPAPIPPQPIVVGLAARLIWSKGIDIAVKALSLVRASGLDVRLHIAGERDGDNPESVSPEEVASWRATQGVVLCGRVSDINTFWAGAHIACLPSRGGEGLPRSLLEAAACGRPIVTTDVPGCAEFVSDGGLVVPTGDAHALAAAFRRLALDENLRTAMGAAGRARVIAGYTTEHVEGLASSAWKRLL